MTASKLRTINHPTLRGKESETSKSECENEAWQKWVSSCPDQKDTCCVQSAIKTSKDRSARCINIKNEMYKFFWNGMECGTDWVIMAERWVKGVTEMKRINIKIMLVKLIVGKQFSQLYVHILHRLSWDKIKFGMTWKRLVLVASVVLWIWKIWGCAWQTWML